MYVFMNEHPTFTAFNDSQALFWHKQDLVYGDWTGGPHGDGSYTKEGVVDCGQSTIIFIILDSPSAISEGVQEVGSWYPV
ncbi:hypothetical protein X801_05885 [Opisthorchis viverrini]|uniref:Uncharacterized protein n=1 Tax=Opisthorchis viverrini TaxID=6198 RepID=A0A1S8WVA8_OPIVI|nr:hypothetical protein X801_05885 [Opisthorchis viverrini]